MKLHGIRYFRLKRCDDDPLILRKEKPYTFWLEDGVKILNAEGYLMVIGNQIISSLLAKVEIPKYRMDKLCVQPVTDRKGLKMFSNKENPYAWQEEARIAFDKKVNQNQTPQTTFTILNHPGSGKTKGTGLLIKHAIENFGIDMCLVLYPTNIIGNQWPEELSGLGLSLSNKLSNRRLTKHARLDKTLDGITASYQSVEKMPSLYKKICQDYNTIVVLDEVHHLGENQSWGKAAVEAFRHARIIISLSGTPIRSDRTLIPFQNYQIEE